MIDLSSDDDSDTTQSSERSRKSSKRSMESEYAASVANLFLKYFLLLSFSGQYFEVPSFGRETSEQVFLKFSLWSSEPKNNYIN